MGWHCQIFREEFLVSINQGQISHTASLSFQCPVEGSEYPSILLLDIGQRKIWIKNVLHQGLLNSHSSKVL